MTLAREGHGRSEIVVGSYVWREGANMEAGEGRCYLMKSGRHAGGREQCGGNGG